MRYTFGKSKMRSTRKHAGLSRIWAGTQPIVELLEGRRLLSVTDLSSTADTYVQDAHPRLQISAPTRPSARKQAVQA